MKKIILFISLLAASVLPSMAEGADWYLYLYSYTNSAYLDMPQFQTTADADVFKISNYELTETSVQFCVTNEAWSSVYGWGSGSVETSGAAVTLATATGATGWISLAAGTYDITFNSTDLTIQFDAVGEGPALADWYLYIWSDESSSQIADEQFYATESDDVFTISNFDLAETGVKFCVRNSAWSTMYGWEADGDAAVATSGEAVHLGSTTTANGWISLPAGTYNVTFNTTDQTIQFDAVGEETTTWYLYVYSEAQEKAIADVAFEATENEGIFSISDFALTETEVKFCVRDAEWTLQLGWTDDAAATVSTAGTAAQLGESTGATGWIGLAAGTYDVTFNSTDKTIVFNLPISTDASSVDARQQCVKLLRNGQVLIIRDGVSYNTIGQVVR